MFWLIRFFAEVKVSYYSSYSSLLQAYVVIGSVLLSVPGDGYVTQSGAIICP